MSYQAETPALSWMRLQKPQALDLIDKLLRGVNEVDLAIGDDLEVRLRPTGVETRQSPTLSTDEVSSGLVLQPNAGDVWIEGHRIETLTRKEFDALRCLYSRQGTVVPKEDLCHVLWTDRSVADCAAALDKLTSRLRAKIEPEPRKPRYLITVRGRGYRLNTD